LIDVATVRELNRCREHLGRLADSRFEAESIQRETIVDLQRVIGFDRWCLPLADPDTLVPLSGIAEHNFGARVGRALELEYGSGDFATKHALGRGPKTVQSLSCETRGDLARSPRWDEVMRPVGIGDIAAAACRDPFGCWGWIELYRDQGDRKFDDYELALLADAGRILAPALRRSFVGAPDTAAAEPSSPGVIVLKADLSLASWTAEARAWAAVLPAASLFAAWKILHAIVYTVATRARSSETAHGARARERCVTGRWLVIEAAPLEGDDDGKIAVTLRPAVPTETFDLLCLAYGLTRRERALTDALIAGLDTRAISERLFISRHTVQDHLKSIFDKVNVHSRRELLATLGWNRELG
jgi:DNA-binding CsgD family transcriptional regulator